MRAPDCGDGCFPPGASPVPCGFVRFLRVGCAHPGVGSCGVACSRHRPGGGLAPAFPELGEAAALTRKTARLAVPFFRVRKRKLCAISDLPRCCVPCTLLHGGCAENLRFRLPTSRSRRSSCADVGSAEPRSGSHSRLRLHAMREHCAGRQRLDELCRCTVRNRSALLRVFSRLTASRRAAASKRSRGKTSAGTRSLADAVAVGLLRSGHLMNSVTLFTGVAPGRCRELFSANGPSRAVL